MDLQIADFAFMCRSKIIRPLNESDIPQLMPIDLKLSKRRKRALLLLHGFASSPAVYRAMLPHFQGYDRIVCPVLPGHGQSIQAFAQCTAQDWRASAFEHCAQLVDAYSEVSVLGFSIGGVLGLELSHAFPLHHLYLLAPALKLYYSLTLAQLAARTLISLGCSRLVNHAGDFYTDRYQELTYHHLPIPAIVEVLKLIQSQTYQPPGCATDLFLGRHDKVVHSRIVAQHYARHPQVQIHWLQHSAHMLPLDGDIELLLQHVNRAAL